EIRELAAVYALGGLDGEDRVRFEALLQAGDPEATIALSDFEATLSDLAAESTAQPPQSVKTALMERIASDRGPSTASVASARPSVRRRVAWPAVWAGAMAAGIVAVVVGLSISARYEERVHALAREAASLRAELDRQQEIIAMLGDP